jgi:hypothetical protein
MKGYGPLAIALACLLTFAAAEAQVPALLNYQGRLVDGSGLVNGDVEMSIRLYNQSSGGTLELEDSNTVTVIDGLYRTYVGDYIVSGSLAQALTNAEVWIEIEVDGIILTPRERLVSVAYAMSADETDPVWTAEKSGYATGTPLYVFTESDPVWSSEKSGYATGTPLYAYTETDPVWLAEKAGYATGTPLYVEVDPIWTAASNDIQSQISHLDTAKVSKAGDTMTGPLIISNSLTVGDLTAATGLFSHAEGGYNFANGTYSHAEGESTEANAYGSHAEGGVTRTYGIFSHAEGRNSEAYGESSHAEGYETVATGDYSHAEGNMTRAEGEASHAEGSETVATGQFSHAEGEYTFANGKSSHAEGGYTFANGRFSHAEGDSAIANGWGSHAEGGVTRTDGRFSHAEGYKTVATGEYSHAEGQQTFAGGRVSHAQGYRARALHDNTFIWADGTDIDFDTITTNEFAVRAEYGLRLVGGPFIGDGQGITNIPTASITEVDPVWTAEKSAYATGTPLYAYTESDPVWTAEKAGYATGTPLYVFTETDPVWTAESNSIGTRISNNESLISNLDTAKVSKTGDTMTGALNINAGSGGHIVIGSTGVNVSIGNAANGNLSGVAVGSGADGYNAGVAVGLGANGSATGVALGYAATGVNSIAIGHTSRATSQGVAIGNQANGGTQGVGVGHTANAYNTGVAVGGTAVARQSGTAVGYIANGDTNGAAVGRAAAASGFGAALGQQAYGYNQGTAVGGAANAAESGVAVGYNANGSMTNVAIGHGANTGGGSERIAIGHNTLNYVDNTAVIRGSLYLDGSTTIMHRAAFGIGNWERVFPLPDLMNVVWVATNGSSSALGTIDDPFDTPQNGYSAAAGKYTNAASTVVIAGGVYPNYLLMTQGCVHVLGFGRPELDILQVDAPKQSWLAGKQRVENVVIRDNVLVMWDGNVKFHNTRMEGGLTIWGNDVEVQDCYIEGGYDAVVEVGVDEFPSQRISIYNSSMEQDNGALPVVQVNSNVWHFEMLHNEIVHTVTNATAPAIEDLETNPIQPVHLYAHNVIKGPDPNAGSGIPAIRTGSSTPSGPSVAVNNNVVWGHLGSVGTLATQYYANNSVYGLLNWGQSGAGASDPLGNVQMTGTLPQLPDAWDD